MNRNLLSLMLLGSIMPSASAEEPRALIDRAIRAHGGESALRKATLLVRSGTGVLSYFGKELPFADELIVDLPDRLRLGVTLEGQPKQLWVINGTMGWQSIAGATSNLPRGRLDELREEAFVQWAATLLPLRREQFTLTASREAKVQDRPVAVVKATAKGHGDLLLSFDKETGLLVQLARRAREGGVEVDKEYLYAAHRDFDGVKLPTSIIETLNGKKFSELSSVKYQFLRSRDDTLFGKP
jgi:hypothetical protein